MQRTAYVFVMLIVFIFISCDSDLKWVGELDSKKDEKAVSGICGTKECGHTEYEFRGKTYSILCGECTDGYECVSNDCKDINECAENNGGCKQICKNTDGGRTCECENGYNLATDGKDCEDIDECKTNNGGCDQICVNNDGGRDCDCNQGYILGDDDITCDDIDECSDIELNTCSEFADCFNTVGDFNCECRENYSGDGKDCVADTRIQSCTDLEDNASWNTASSITQTWNGTKWAPSTTGIYSATPSSEECRFKCKVNYLWNGSNCVADTKIFNCSVKPAGSVWNTVSEYTQTWSGTEWVPSESSTEYNATPANDSCRYKCAETYTWNGLVCVTDTRTFHCNEKPSTGTVWNTASEYIQTWNGTKWMPEDSETEYSETPASDLCRYKCAVNYTWGGLTCVADTKNNQSCTGKPANSFWNTASSITQTWNGTEWVPSVTGLFNATSSTTECRFKCDINYTWNSGNGLCEADTKSDQACTGNPANSVWNTASSITQTWNGAAWMPSTVGLFSETSSTTECRFKCSPFYELDGDSCVRYGAMCTGQTLCYNETTTMTCPNEGQAYYGQDSQYKTLGACFLRDYTMSVTAGNDIVTDNNTGLVWQRTVSTSTYTWQNAINYCSDLTYAGQTDWRLPTRQELTTLPDYGRYNSTIDTAVFPGTQSSWYWTFSSYVGSANADWHVDFNDGSVDGENKTYNDYARCVRGSGLPVNSFTESTVSGKVIVTDAVTGLIWQKEYNSSTTWSEALNYCENSTYAGLTDWRLPNIEELKTLIDDLIYNPASSFPAMPSSSFWSSSSYGYDPYNAWGVHFTTGHVYYSNKPYNKDARCVR